MVRTGSGDLVVLVEGQLFRLAGGGWDRIAGAPRRKGGPEDASVAAFLRGDIPIDEMRFGAVRQVVPDPAGDGVLLIEGDLLLRVTIDGDIEAVAQDVRLTGSRAALVGGGLVVLDGFGELGVLEEGL